jgi:hypothetical protein
LTANDADDNHEACECGEIEKRRHCHEVSTEKLLANTGLRNHRSPAEALDLPKAEASLNHLPHPRLRTQNGQVSGGCS